MAQESPSLSKTTIYLKDKTLVYSTTDPARYNCPMSLDTLAQIVDVSDQSRVILFARHGFMMPSNIRGVIRCGI